MKNLDALTQEFNTKYERFFIGCDAVEDSGLWDIEEYGDMEAFYQNDLVSVIIRLIAADGSISSKEVEYLNKSFGFEYTVEELNEVYKSCKDDIGSYFDEQFQNGISVMRSKNEKLAARSYIRYYDANGKLRVFYNTYKKSMYGGCMCSFNQVAGMAIP